MRSIALAVLALIALALPARAADLPTVDKAWSRPATVKVGVVYMRVTGGATDMRLTGASSPLSTKVEIHETRMKGGMMDMRETDGVAIPKGKVVEFRTGGLHLMLIGLKQPLTAGMRFPVTLTFGAAGKSTVEVEVRRRAPK